MQPQVAAVAGDRARRRLSCCQLYQFLSHLRSGLSIHGVSSDHLCLVTLVTVPVMRFERWVCGKDFAGETTTTKKMNSLKVRGNLV